ncbi:uncharacterized protein ACLA_081810 [Aspergillus clavatus NRRL 1]|uniref:Uncharacterized protein n=1 Tax=Aspergillus clavatus (strain ATCC 1007 / CBS 513.65 / DSM 816 / NCTC 3887 / NRRL 1 / QM 1276 / 107) TaxID=344612 RepID=A1CT54_ASPCL|nr:uncharacterized protein ACLA_081810 [Aspergillus clavatus NRRL 1]EAW06491.1 conserved hypothetical protein [Aspergillus clavatus NRRL 1]
MAVLSKMVDEPPNNPQTPESALDPDVLKELQILRANAKRPSTASPNYCCPRYFDTRAHDVREPDPVIPCCHPDEWYPPHYRSGANTPDISDKLHDLREPEDVLPLRRNDLFPPYPYGRAEEFKRLRTRDPQFSNWSFPRNLQPLVWLPLLFPVSGEGGHRAEVVSFCDSTVVLAQYTCRLRHLPNSRTLPLQKIRSHLFLRVLDTVREASKLQQRTICLLAVTTTMFQSQRSTKASTPTHHSPYTPQPVAVKFHEIDAHTAKCDLCNTRNASGMSRCDACGWQACYKCLLDNGCDRTHTGNGRVHTGTIDPKDIARQIGRRRRGRGGVRKGEEEDYDDGEVVKESGRLKRRLLGRSKDGKGGDTSPLSSQGCISANENSPTSDKALDAARDLLAFSIEAWSLAVQEDARNGRHSTALGADDVVMGMNGQQLHEYAQCAADLAVQQYLHSKPNQKRQAEYTLSPSENNGEGSSETSKSATMPSKAQVFARKSAGGRRSR